MDRCRCLPAGGEGYSVSGIGPTAGAAVPGDQQEPRQACGPAGRDGGGGDGLRRGRRLHRRPTPHRQIWWSPLMCRWLPESSLMGGGSGPHGASSTPKRILVIGWPCATCCLNCGTGGCSRAAPPRSAWPTAIALRRAWIARLLLLCEVNDLAARCYGVTFENLQSNH